MESFKDLTDLNKSISDYFSKSVLSGSIGTKEGRYKYDISATPRSASGKLMTPMKKEFEAPKTEPGLKHSMLHAKDVASGKEAGTATPKGYVPEAGTIGMPK